MTQELIEDTDRHEKVRFRRDEIVDLSRFPSAVGIEPPAAPRPKKRQKRAQRWLIGLLGACAAVVLIFLVGLHVIGSSGIGAEKLTQVVQTSLKEIFGYDIDASIGEARFSIRGPGTLTLNLHEVRIAEKGSERTALDADAFRLRLNSWSLLRGKVDINSATLEGAKIAVQALPRNSDSDWMTSLKNEAGLIEPDKLLKFIFTAADQIATSLGSSGAPQLELKDVSFELPAGLPSQLLTIKEANLDHPSGGIGLTGVADIGGRAADFRATIERDDRLAQVKQFELSFHTPKQASETQSFSFGDLAISLIGTQGKEGKLQANITGDSISLDLGTRGKLEGNIDVAATLTEGAGKLEIDRLNTRIGRSTFAMTGAVGPKPAAQDAKPAYRFELVSPESTLAPVDSGEPAMPLSLRLAGNYEPEAGKIDVQQVGISSQTGTALGNAMVELTEKGPPGLALALDVNNMSVSHVKQLWPWFAAGSARRWVHTNLFGGTVPEGFIRFAVVPGRLGNGQKLNSSEVYGRFRIQTTRFDTAGLLPPIRDADGEVKFAGDDVDISLDRGSVFLASGKSVSADQGKLIISDAGKRPVIGQLDINVAGDAAAIAELASLDPINAMRNTGIEASSLSGAVTGHVNAKIPLHKGIDRSLLGWQVDLKFQDLAISKPVDGQMISAADGTISLDKQRALIKSKAQLNGIPAELDLVQPLAGSQGIERQRNIALAIDEKTQRRISPALDDFVEGTVRLKLDANEPGQREFKADLTDVKLSLPMVGWTKGEGISAELAFKLDTNGATSTVSDFELTGKSFGISGAMTVANGNLRTAKFDQFQLNRDDDVAVSIEPAGKGYLVSVSGESLDARSIIRRATTPDGEAKPSSQPISLKGKLTRMTGFNDVGLSNVDLAYSGNGLSLDAQTAKGKAVKISNEPDGAGRRMVITSQDAGALLRFFDIYKRVEGGTISLAMASSGSNYAGQLDIRNFWVVDEPKLGSIVSASPSPNGRSLEQTVQNKIDTKRVQFERGFADIEKGPSYLKLANGVLRGPMVGSTFQGTLYDENNRINMTGTFMPAYGLNRIFGELPLIGEILGNGRDRGLIGVTYKLTGNFKSPQLQINPLSVIAPGIFRTIFEFQ